MATVDKISLEGGEPYDISVAAENINGEIPIEKIPNITSEKLPTATTGSKGAVKPDGTTITVDNSGIISAAIPYLEQIVTLLTTDSVTVTFTDSRITANSCVEVGISEQGIVPEDVSVTTGSCTVTLPAVSIEKTRIVRLYLR